jgi:hypothetical protein
MDKFWCFVGGERSTYPISWIFLTTFTPIFEAILTRSYLDGNGMVVGFF